jgi:hypothetical protein
LAVLGILADRGLKQRVKTEVEIRSINSRLLFYVEQCPNGVCMENPFSRDKSNSNLNVMYFILVFVLVQFFCTAVHNFM